MNKQELIDKLKRHLTVMSEIEGSEYDKGYKYATKQNLAMIAELDEPEKPTVPQCVADFISSEQRSCSALSEAIDNMEMRDEGEVTGWFYDNSETFAKAWLYGYEIEKDKLYTVELPNPNAGGHVVLCKTSDGIVSIAFAGMARWKGGKNFQLTESEIKEDFEWAWQFAEEVK